jgi:hypothetical protein
MQIRAKVRTEYGARLDHELLAPLAGPGQGREEFVVEPGTVPVL